MEATDLPLKLGDSGPAVDDLRRRLGRAGFLTTVDAPATFGEETEAQVRSFQASRGIDDHGTVGHQTFTALMDAEHSFGDRTLYLRNPMLSGEDVAELQRRLGALGFNAGRIDGIFGPDCASAVAEFQTNVALTVDSVCGRDTFAELMRVGSRSGSQVVAETHDHERLLRLSHSGDPSRVAVGDLGEFAGLAHSLGALLSEAGLDVLTIHHPDAATHAIRANEHDALCFIGFRPSDSSDAQLSFYETEGYVSHGGAQLAGIIGKELAGAELSTAEPVGMRTQVLRRTKMPAVVCRIDRDTDDGLVAGAITNAVLVWIDGLTSA